MGREVIGFPTLLLTAAFESGSQCSGMFRRLVKASSLPTVFKSGCIGNAFKRAAPYQLIKNFVSLSQTY